MNLCRCRLTKQGTGRQQRPKRTGDAHHETGLAISHNRRVPFLECGGSCREQERREPFRESELVERALRPSCPQAWRGSGTLSQLAGVSSEFLGLRCGIPAIQVLIHMRSSMPCSKLRACAGLRNCFEPARDIPSEPEWPCSAFNVVRLKPPGSVHINASSQSRKSPPFMFNAKKHGERYCLKPPPFGPSAAATQLL